MYTKALGTIPNQDAAHTAATTALGGSGSIAYVYRYNDPQAHHDQSMGLAVQPVIGDIIQAGPVKYRLHATAQPYAGDGLYRQNTLTVATAADLQVHPSTLPVGRTVVTLSAATRANATRDHPGILTTPYHIGRHAMALNSTIVHLRKASATLQSRGLGLRFDPPLFTAFDTLTGHGGVSEPGDQASFIRCHINHTHLTTITSRPPWQGIPGAGHVHRREVHHVGRILDRHDYWFVYQDTGDTVSDADADCVREVVVQFLWNGRYHQ